MALARPSWPALIVWPFLLFILLLPFAKLAELGCLIALILLFKLRARIAWGYGVLALLSITAAALISSIDATSPADASASAVNLLRFAGLVLIATQLSSAQHRWLQQFVACLLLIWLLDASIQALSGFSLGGRAGADRLSGVFGADNLKLGPVLGALSPLLLFAPWPLADAKQRIFLLRAGIWLLLAAILLLAGSRASWVCFAVASMLAGFVYWRDGHRVNPKRASVVAAATAMLLAVMALGLYQFDARVKARVDRTLTALQPAGLDNALAGRLPIWQTALKMSAAHPINGVGIREFRSAYSQYAATDDPWLHQSASGRIEGAYHPHQIVLEITAETGVLGLLAWGFVLILGIRAWQRAHLSQRATAWPYAAALIVMCFPINTHLAFYSSFWSSVFWWLIALYFAAIACSQATTPEVPTAATGGAQIANP